MTKDTILLRLLKEEHITLEEFRVLDNPGEVITINDQYVDPFNLNKPQFPDIPNHPLTIPCANPPYPWFYPTICQVSPIYRSGPSNTTSEL